jgi:hypothetical protein
MQYLFHFLTANRHRAHIQRFINEAKEMAWRPHGGNAPVSTVRKYVTLGDQSEEAIGPSRKFAVEFDGRVFFVDEKTGEEALLDVDDVERASWKRTLVYTLPIWAWNAVRNVQGKAKTGGGVERTQEVAETNANGATEEKPKYTKAEKVAGGRRKSKKRA